MSLRRTVALWLCPELREIEQAWPTAEEMTRLRADLAQQTQKNAEAARYEGAVKAEVQSLFLQSYLHDINWLRMCREIRAANSQQGKTMEQPVRNQHPFMAAVVRSISDRTEAEVKDLMAKLDELWPTVEALGVPKYTWAIFRNEAMEDARKQIEARLSHEAAEKLFHEGEQEIKREVVKGEAVVNVSHPASPVQN